MVTTSMKSVPDTEVARTVTVMGATGSVGQSTIDLIRRHKDRYTVEALVANRNAEALAADARALNAKFAVLADPDQYSSLKAALSGSGIEIAAGADAVTEAGRRPADWVMAAITGAAGLESTLAAVRRGAIVALANKETLVCAGSIVMAEAARHGATILPVDSEHNAIFQVFDFTQREGIEKIILTASGGPFRTWSMQDMSHVTPAQAVAHPNWSMGAKISVDSATMMNKGLEIIEAHHLFNLSSSEIDVVVHPQSVIHSMVAYRDGSVLAQLGSPDMRTPIAYALGWPQRIDAPCARLDFAKIAQLTFEVPDTERFPALRLARQAMEGDGALATVLNAANEIAVAAFLEERIRFLDIAIVVEETMAILSHNKINNLAEIMALDAQARQLAHGQIKTRMMKP